MNPNPKGVFMGTVLNQFSGTLGGARSVFVKLTGPKNDLVFPTHGGKLENPFAQGGKIFAGDIFEYRTDDNGQNPVLFLLKTFEVAEAVASDATEVVIKNDGYRHVPSIGDNLMVAPSTITGKGTAVTVLGVKRGSNAWTVTLSAPLGVVKEGAVLVEAVEAGANKEMLVQNPNSFAPCDYDLPLAPAVDENDFEGARYFLTPALHATAYISRMCPLPSCVLKLNESKINGWFRL